MLDAAKTKAATSQNATAKSPDFVHSCPEYGQGWIVKGFIRQNGEQKGHTDKYWYSPCGRKFRSKKEVERFLKESEATNTSNSTTETYIIKNILGRAFRSKKKRTEYLIRWEGYPDPANFTFEPIEHLGHRQKEPKERWGADSEADPDDPDKIEVNDIERDSSDVLRYAQLEGYKTNISTSGSDDEDNVDGTYEKEEEEEEEEEEEAMEAAAEQDSNDRKDDSVNEVATNGDHKTSTTSTEVGAPLSFDSDSLHQPNDDEEDMRDDASASSETTCNDTGSLL